MPLGEARLSAADQERLADLRGAVSRLAPLELPLPPPEPGDWLAVRPEPGQSLDDFFRRHPPPPSGPRPAVLLQPLGHFKPEQRRVADLTARFLRVFFNLPVETLRDASLSVVPLEARRRHPEWGDHQVLTRWVLDELLAPAVPAGAGALVCLTDCDLWPGEGWNFVYGEADVARRVAVWSLYRNGDPSSGPDGFRLCLRRTLHTAAHEVAHLLGLHHEVGLQCLMNGSNHRDEADRRPLWLCPVSLAKLCWATGDDPIDHSRRVEAYLRLQGLDRDASLHRQTLALLEAPGGREGQ